MVGNQDTRRLQPLHLYNTVQYTVQFRNSLASPQYLVCQHVATGVVAVVGDHQPGGQLAGLRVVQGLHQLDRSVQFGTQYK